jgi:hypothetical protein
MIDLLRRHVVILASAVLGWAGYSFYDAGSAKPEAQAKGQMLEIGAKFLALRDPSMPFEISSDPYRFDRPAERPAGHAPTAVATAAHPDAAWDDGFVGPVLPPPTPPLSQADLVIALAGALRLANEIGALAEKEWHHPDLELGWGRVVVSIQTHAVGGLTLNDFVLAAKIDRLVARRGGRKARRRA